MSGRGAAILCRAIGERRAVGAGGAAAAQAAQAQAGTDRPSAGAGSGRSGRDRVRAQDRDQLERAARRARLWVRSDLLAAATAVAAGRGLGPAAPGDARPPRPAGPAGLVAGGGGQRERAGQAPRRGHRALADRSREGGQQVPRALRPRRAPAACAGHRGEHPRQSDARPAAGHQPRRPRTGGTAGASATSAGQGARRQGLRLSPLPPLPEWAWDRGADRPARDRGLHPARAGPLGRRAHHVLAAGLPPAAARSPVRRRWTGANRV